MEYKEAADILISLLDKHPLDAEEKEAVKTAIGVLGWATLAKSKIKARAERSRSARTERNRSTQKAKRDKRTKR